MVVNYAPNRPIPTIFPYSHYYIYNIYSHISTNPHKYMQNQAIKSHIAYEIVNMIKNTGMKESICTGKDAETGEDGANLASGSRRAIRRWPPC